MKIGFVGLGIMGRPMCKNLLKAGLTVAAYDPFAKEALDDVVACGAIRGTSNADVASMSDVVITMVPNSPHVREAVFGKGGIAEGFVTASLIYCVGAMAVVGSLQSGLTGNHEMLYTKSMLDGISSMVLSASLGIGVALSALSVLVYQGAITLLAQVVAPVLTEAIVAEMTCVGSLMIMGLGLNMLGVTKLKVMDYVPAIAIVIPLCYVM